MINAALNTYGRKTNSRIGYRDFYSEFPLEKIQKLDFTQKTKLCEIPPIWKSTNSTENGNRIETYVEQTTDVTIPMLGLDDDISKRQ